MYRLPIKIDSSLIQAYRYSRSLSSGTPPSAKPTPSVPPNGLKINKPATKAPGDRNPSGGSRIGRKILLSALGSVLFTGATIVYAKSNPGLREWLKKNQPWAEDVISIFDFEKHFSGSWTKPLISMPSKLTPILPSKQPSEIRLREDRELAPKHETVKEPPTLMLVNPEIVVKPTKEIEKTDTPTPILAAEPTIDKDISKTVPLNNEEALQAVNLAVQSYEVATRSLRKHYEQIYEVIESAVDSQERSAWEKVKELGHKKNANYHQAVENANKARSHIATIESSLHGGKISPELKKTWKEKLNEWRASIKHAESTYNAVKESGNITDKYWNQIEKARTTFSHELQSLFPNLDIYSKKLNLADGSDPATELDLLLLHMLKVVTHLHKELAASTTIRRHQVENALKNATDQDIINARVAEELEKERRDMTIDFQKKVLANRIELENELRRQLKLQVEVHRDHLNDALFERENQIRSTVEQSLSEKIESDRANYKLQLASMVGKLKGVDDALKARSQTDKLARQSVALWSAGESILNALRKGPSFPSSETSGFTSLQHEIKAIQAAAVESDELVSAVLAGIPSDVKENGVYSESALKERFSKVEKLCRRVALVPEEGASLPIYILSWLQSFLLFSSIEAIPQSELEDQPTDFSKLDTYDILQRAKYCVERGDIRGAVQYMSLISGAARQVSSDWTRAARDHLATRQAAEVVMAHATAAGMLYL